MQRPNEEKDSKKVHQNTKDDNLLNWSVKKYRGLPNYFSEKPFKVLPGPVDELPAFRFVDSFTVTFSLLIKLKEGRAKLNPRIGDVKEWNLIMTTPRLNVCPLRMIMGSEMVGFYGKIIFSQDDSGFIRFSSFFSINFDFKKIPFRHDDRSAKWRIRLVSEK